VLGQSVRADVRALRWPYLLGALLSFGLIAPFLFRENAWYEWAFGYWLIVVQHNTIHASGLPSLFIHSSFTGLYYPSHIFYGGFGITVLGYLSLLVTPWVAFVSSFVLAIFGAFVGLYWTASYLGLRTPVAVAFAAAGISVPYYLTDLYGRGAWTEFVAVSMVPLLLGSTIRFLVESKQGRSGKLALTLIAVSTSFIVGMHNITTLLGFSFLAVVAVPLVWTLGVGTDWRRIARIAAALAIGAGLTATWFIPNVWLAHRTTISHIPLAGAVAAFDHPSVVLWPTLKWPAAQTHVSGVKGQLYNQTSSLFILPMMLLTAIAAWQGLRRRSRSSSVEPAGMSRSALVTAGVLGGAAIALFLLMTHNSWWTTDKPWFMRLVPPLFLRSIQFPLRLNSYLSLSILLLVAVLLVGVSSNTRAARVALALFYAVSVWYVALGFYQAYSAQAQAYPSVREVTRAASITADSPPPTLGTFQADQFRLTEDSPPIFPAPRAHIEFRLDGRAPTTANVAPATSYTTNIVWSPLVGVHGAQVTGHAIDGLAVIRTDSDTSAPSQLQAHSVYPKRVVLGFAISAASALTALLVLGIWSARAVSQRQARKASAGAAWAGGPATQDPS
jgi:hypothetical protein